MTQDETDNFHRRFNKQAGAILERVREALIDYGPEPTGEQITAQILMDMIGDGGVSPLGIDASLKGKYTLEHKQRLLAIAEHMGPDYAQGLYHAAVFITKLA